MKDKQIYFSALETLIEITINHQKIDEIKPYLVNICDSLNQFFETKEFTPLLQEKISFYESLLLNDDGSLFIQDAHIPYLIKQNLILGSKNKTDIYIIILEWVKKINLPSTEIYFKLASQFRLPPSLSQTIEDFIFNRENLTGSINFLKLIPSYEGHFDQLEGTWVDTNKPEELKTEEYLSIEEIKHSMFAVYLEETNSFVITCDEMNVGLNKNDNSSPGDFCQLTVGDSVQVEEDNEISYTELKKKFIEKSFGKRFILTADNVEYSFKNQRGIKSFSFSALPGQLLGIIGKEGAVLGSMLCTTLYINTNT